MGSTMPDDEQETLVSARPTGLPDEGVVEGEGARLAFRIEGQGQACLVLGSVRLYSRVLSSSLRERLQLVFIDLRHFAASAPDFSPDQISIDMYAADVERARHGLELGDVIVIGHSVHATVALEYARLYPGHVRGVIVFGSTPHGLDDADAALDDQFWQEASEERRALRAQRKGELTPELRESLSPAQFFVREYVARGPLHFYDMTYDGTWLWEGTELNMPVLECFYQVIDALTLVPGEITTPVLIIHGRYDYGSPYPLWERHRYKLPRHTFALFDKSGHFPPLEEPAAVDETIVSWIGDLT
jgi:proline iminopeptidase